MAYLRHWFNGQPLSIFELGESVTIGRHPDCEIRVEDATMSARHACIRRSLSGYEVEDLGSTNGLAVAGQKVPRWDLANQCTFTLGTQEFEFLDELPDDLGATLKIKKSWIPGIYFAKGRAKS